MIEFRGIEFRAVDNRLMALEARAARPVSGVAMFGADREVLQPSEALRKKAILVERGSFRPPTHRQHRHARVGPGEVRGRPRGRGRTESSTLTELTMRNLLAGGTDVDRRDFLARADLLAACGKTVLISDYVDYYRLAAYLGERTDERIGMVMGVPSLIDLFDEKNHAHLPGGILESFGRLFKNDLKLFVYPVRKTDGRAADHGRTTCSVGPDLQPLYDYLAAARQLRRPRQLQARVPAHLQPRRAAPDRRSATTAGRRWCPTEVADLIKKRSFFGYPEHPRLASRRPGVAPSHGGVTLAAGREHTPTAPPRQDRAVGCAREDAADARERADREHRPGRANRSDRQDRADRPDGQDRPARGDGQYRILRLDRPPRPIVFIHPTILALFRFAVRGLTFDSPSGIWSAASRGLGGRPSKRHGQVTRQIVRAGGAPVGDHDHSRRTGRQTS